MGITLPAIGSPAWGPPVNNALTELAVGAFTPEEHGLVTWNYDPSQMSTVGTPVSGTVRMVRLPNFPQNVSITSLAFHVGTSATTPVAGQCFAGLYNFTGSLLAVTADLSTVVATAGSKVVPLTAPHAAVPGNYWVGLLFNAATPPALSCTATSSPTRVNFNLLPEQSRFADGPAAQTTLPALITMSALVQSAQSTWAGAA